MMEELYILAASAFGTGLVVGIFIGVLVRLEEEV